MSRYKIKSNKGFYVGDPCYVLNEVYKKIWGNKYDYETSDSEHLVVPKGF